MNDDKMLVSDETRSRIESLMPQSTAPQPVQPVDADQATRSRVMQLMQEGQTRTTTGGPESRMAMFPDEYVDENTDRMGAFERGYRSFAAGFMSSIPGAMTQLGGVIDYLGADGAGEALTEQGMEWGDWINEHVAVEDPTLANQIASGFGSLAFFMLPGLGSAGIASKTARGLGLVHKVAKGGKAVGDLSKAGRTFQTVFQAGTMATLEAAVEQSQRMEELIGQGQTPEEALKNSEKVFWQNMVMLTATNAPFFSPVGRLARATMSAGSEGAQERFQSVIQDVASGTGEWKDFLDPGKYQAETIVGMVTGGTVGGILPGEAKPGDDKETDTPDPTKVDPEKYEGDEPAGFGADPIEAEAVPDDVAEVEEAEAAGAPEADLQRQAAKKKVERVLTEQFDEPTRLEGFLDPGQINEVIDDAIAAINETDDQKAWAMQDELIKKINKMADDNYNPEIPFADPVKQPEVEPEKTPPTSEEDALADDKTGDPLKGAKQAEIFPGPTTETEPVAAEEVAGPKDAEIFPAPESTRKDPKKTEVTDPVSGEVITAEEAQKRFTEAQEKMAQKKSTGHLGFATRPDGVKVEYYEAPDGDVHSAPVYNPVATDGYRGGRWFGTRKFFDGQGVEFDEVAGVDGEQATETAPTGAAEFNQGDRQPVYRGSGRADATSAYGGVAVPIAGDGTYYASGRSDAETYGPEIEEVAIGDVVKNPLRIDSDQELRGLFKEAGYWPDPWASEEDARIGAERLRKLIMSKGHDGLVVSIPDSIYDMDPTTGRSWTFMRKTFGHSTVVAYSQESPATETKPTPVEKIKQEAKKKAAKKPKKAKVPKPKEGGKFSSVDTRNEFDSGDERLIKDIAARLRSRGVKVTGVKVLKKNTKLGNSMREIGSLFGADVVFFSHSKKDAAIWGGVFSPGQGKRIFINDHGAEPLHYLLGHELGHYIETHYPKQFKTIMDAVLSSMSPMSRAGYKAQLDKSYPDSQVMQEFVSDLIGEQFTKDEFWDYLKANDMALFEKVVKHLRDVLKKIKTQMMSRGQFDVYVKSYAGIELTIREAMSSIAAETKAQKVADIKAGVPSGIAIVQPSLTVRDPEMKKVLDEKERTREGVLDRIRTKLSDIPRLLYQRMIDADTFLYAAEKRVLKMTGRDIADYDPTKRPYHALRLMAGWTQKAHQSLTDVVMSWDGTRELGPGLQRIIKKFNLGAAIDNGEFGQYATFARMKAVFDVRGMNYFTGDKKHFGKFDESVLDEEQREAYIDYENNMAIMERYNKLEPKWAQAVQEISDWNANTLERGLESGFFTQEEYDKLVDTYELYVPMNVMEREDTQNKEVVYRLGEYKNGAVHMDPIDSMIKKAYRLEFLINLNNVKITAAEFVEELAHGRSSLKDFGRRVFPKTRPLQDYVEIIAEKQGVDLETATDDVKKSIEITAEMYASAEFEKEGVVSFKRNGEIEYWQFAPEILDVLTSQGGKANHAFMKFFSAQTSMLRAGAILTPEFMATNQFRDFMGAMVLSKHFIKNPADVAMAPFRILQGLASAISHTRGKEVEIVRDYINAGGGGGTFVSPDMKDLRKASEDLTGKKNLLHFSPITVLQELTNLFESSTRLAVFKQARDSMVAAGVPFDKATKLAALDAREASTDFARMGEYGAVLNRIIPFFNAGLQGNDKLIRSVFKDKGNRAATITKGMMLITAPTIALWLLNHDEDWYKEQPLFVKNHFWLFSVDNGKTIHKLVKPFEIGMIFGSMVERFLDYRYDKDPKAVESWAKDFTNDILTVDGLSLLGPTLATLSEIEANYDVYRRTPIVKGYMEDIAPREQYNSSTSELAKVLGGAFPGKGKSPMMIDHFIRGAFGGLGTHAADIVSNMVMFADPDRREAKRASRKIYGLVPDWTPIIRRVVATTPSRYNRNTKDFFDEYDGARETYNTFKAFESGGASEEQRLKMLEIDGVGLEKYKVLQDIAKLAGDISQKIAAVERADPSVFDRNEKARLIDDALAKRNEVFKKGMAKFNSVDWDEVQKKINKEVEKIRSKKRSK